MPPSTSTLFGDELTVYAHIACTLLGWWWRPPRLSQLTSPCPSSNFSKRTMSETCLEDLYMTSKVLLYLFNSSKLTLLLYTNPYSLECIQPFSTHIYLARSCGFQHLHESTVGAFYIVSSGWWTPLHDQNSPVQHQQYAMIILTPEGGCEFKSSCRRGAHHHSPPNYGGGS